MIATQANMQSIIQPDISQAYNTMSMMAALQSELAMLQAKVETYYHDEIVLRGDKNMMREYCGHFGIHPAHSNA
jgi:small basic protein